MSSAYLMLKMRRNLRKISRESDPERVFGLRLQISISLVKHIGVFVMEYVVFVIAVCAAVVFADDDLVDGFGALTARDAALVLVLQFIPELLVDFGGLLLLRHIGVNIKVPMKVIGKDPQI